MNSFVLGRIERLVIAIVEAPEQLRRKARASAGKRRFVA
jgi:hypothetical protein